MNGVSFSLLKVRRFHGVLASLAAALAMFSLVASPRASGVVTDGSTTGLYDKLQVTAGLITFATNGTFVLNNWVVGTNTMIDGSGYSVTITANNLGRIFTINSNITLTLTNVTLTGGKTNQGAAILNRGGLLICSNVVFTGNRATNSPGANGYGRQQWTHRWRQR